MEKQKIFAGNFDMQINHFMGFLGCLIVIGLCIYTRYNFTPEPLYEELVRLVLKLVIFVFSILGVIKFYFYLKNSIYAIMDENGIEFKNPYESLGFVPWNDIDSASRGVVRVYQVVGRGKHRHIAKRAVDFYIIVSTDFYVHPDLQLNPKHGGIARTIPYPDSRFEEQLYFYRPDLKPEIRVDDE